MGPRALAALLACAMAAGCYEERARPGPPRLSVVIDQPEVGSPDTLTGRVHATDPDGIDSLWLVADTLRTGVEAFLLEDLEVPFEVVIPSGRSPGEPFPLVFEARDVLGYRSTLDTFVRIAFPQSP